MSKIKKFLNVSSWNLIKKLYKICKKIVKNSKKFLKISHEESESLLIIILIKWQRRFKRMKNWRNVIFIFNINLYKFYKKKLDDCICGGEIVQNLELINAKI